MIGSFNSSVVYPIGQEPLTRCGFTFAWPRCAFTELSYSVVSWLLWSKLPTSRVESLQARSVLRVRYDLQGRITISGSERNTTQKWHRSAHTNRARNCLDQREGSGSWFLKRYRVFPAHTHTHTHIHIVVLHTFRTITTRHASIPNPLSLDTPLSPTMRHRVNTTWLQRIETKRLTADACVAMSELLNGPSQERS